MLWDISAFRPTKLNEFKKNWMKIPHVPYFIELFQTFCKLIKWQNLKIIRYVHTTCKYMSHHHKLQFNLKTSYISSTRRINYFKSNLLFMHKNKELCLFRPHVQNVNCKVKSQHAFQQRHFLTNIRSYERHPYLSHYSSILFLRFLHYRT